MPPPLVNMAQYTRGEVAVHPTITSGAVGLSGGHGGPRGGALQCLLDGEFCRGAGRRARDMEVLEHRQRAAVERSGEGGAAGVGDLGVAEVERLP
jgi:hypothetical protein